MMLPTNVMNLYVSNLEALASPYTYIRAGPNNVRIALSVKPRNIIENMKVILLSTKEENVFTAISTKQYSRIILTAPNLSPSTPQMAAPISPLAISAVIPLLIKWSSLIFSP